VPLAPVPPTAGLPVVPAGVVPMVAPVLEVPLLPLPPPFMLLPESVPFILAPPVPPAGAPMVPPVPVESGVPPTLSAAESVPSVLLGVLVLVPFSPPPQLVSKVPPSSKVARGKKELENRMTSKVRVKAIMPSGIRQVTNSHRAKNTDFLLA
jgi:hypothetical protein